jgi:peptide/nickel transport system substrate-binding protein
VNLRDRAVLGFLALVLVALTGAVVAPSFAPSAPDETPRPSPESNSPYVEGVLGSATSASPFSARTPVERAMVELIFRGLVRLGPGESLVGDLAERWEVDATGSIWTFHLRDGLAWHDGQPLTAADVVFTIDVLSDPQYAGPGAESWREVTASALDARTVVFSLATPLGGFLHAALQPIAPRHLLGGVSAADLELDPFGRWPVGSGSFRLAAFDDVHALLEPATPDPLDSGRQAGSALRPTDSLATPPPTAGSGVPLPYLAGIEFRFFGEAGSLVAAWDAGLLDGASGLAPEAAAGLAETAGARLLRYPTTTLVSVMLNLRATHPELRDPAVRSALLGAIDRDGIVAEALSGQAARADALIPPTSWAFDAAASPPVAHEPDAARLALVAAGWKEAAGGGWIPKGAKARLTIDLLCPEEAVNPTTYAVASAIVEDWRGIGLTVTQTPIPAAELVGVWLRTGEFSAAVLGLGIGLDPDLYPILASTQATSRGSNLAGLQDAGLDKLLAAARAPGPDEARRAAYAALQGQLATGAYLLPIAYRDEVVVVRSTLRGPEIRPIGNPGDRFWDVLTWRLAEGR